MCDIYMHRCSKCERKLPIHLGDFETARNEIEVFCEEHIPEKDVTVFTVTKVSKVDTIDITDMRVGWKMGIRSLTENARRFDHLGYNHPNIASEFKIERK